MVQAGSPCPPISGVPRVHRHQPGTLDKNQSESKKYQHLLTVALGGVSGLLENRVHGSAGFLESSLATREMRCGNCLGLVLSSHIPQKYISACPMLSLPDATSWIEMLRLTLRHVLGLSF